MPFCWVIWKKCLWPTLTSLKMFSGTTIVGPHVSYMHSVSIHTFVSSAVVNRRCSSFHPRRKSRQSDGQWWNLKNGMQFTTKTKKFSVSLGKQGRPVTDPPLVVHLRGNFRSKKSQTEMWKYWVGGCILLEWCNMRTLFFQNRHEGNVAPGLKIQRDSLDLGSLQITGEEKF